MKSISFTKIVILLSAFHIFSLASLSCQKRTSPTQKPGEIGSPCRAQYECREGLVCAHSGTCQDPGNRQTGGVAEGKSCDSNNLCQFGLTCCSSSLMEVRGCKENTCVTAGDEGEPCTTTNDCLFGLVCDKQKHCTPDGVGMVDSPCITSQHCAYQLVCSSEGKCSEPGNGSDGSPCDGAEDCQYGLLCAGDETCRNPENPESSAHGIGQIGDSCLADKDCTLGLTCFLDGKCQAPPYWPGAYCPPDDPDEDFKIYFEIPSLPMEGEIDFYRLPFPNDIRIRNGKVQLDGHPLPPYPSKSRQLVKAWLDAIDNNVSGFSTLPTIFMRFNKTPDFSTIRLANYCNRCIIPAEQTPDCPSGCAQWSFRNFYIVNITPPADPSDPAYMGYGEGVSLGVAVTSGRGKYICQNFILLRPAENSPLRPGATYAVIVTDTPDPSGGIKAISDRGTESLHKDEDFAKLIEGIATGNCSGASMGDPDIESACMLPGYRWLADYLNDENILDHDPNWKDHIKAATVFTTMNPANNFSKFREKFFNCTGSDCIDLPEPEPEDGLINESLSASKFTVHDGKLKMAVIQKGLPPYNSPPDGSIEYDLEFKPIFQHPPDGTFPKASFSLSIPNTLEMPSNGWPVAIFYPDFTSEESGPDIFHKYITSGIAEMLSEITIQIGEPPVEQTTGFAVFSLEPVMHGERKGTAEINSATSFYNLSNPQAMVGNIFSSAADCFQIIRLIKFINEAYTGGTEIPGFEGVNLDPNQIYIIARGEGASASIICSAYEPSIKGMIISQAGGPQSLNLVSRTKPLNFPAIMEIMLAEKSLTTSHPVISLMQNLLDPVDVINYGSKIIRMPPQIGQTTDDPPQPIYAGPHHLLMIFKRDDAFAPENSMVNLIFQLGIVQSDNDSRNCLCGERCDSTGTTGLHDSVCSVGGIDQVEGNIRGNLRSGTISGAFTMITGGDFELFQSQEISMQTKGFLATSFLDPDGIPTIFSP